jgi:hypothetical protein
MKNMSSLNIGVDAHGSTAIGIKLKSKPSAVSSCGASWLQRQRYSAVLLAAEQSSVCQDCRQELWSHNSLEFEFILHGMGLCHVQAGD